MKITQEQEIMIYKLGRAYGIFSLFLAAFWVFWQNFPAVIMNVILGFFVFVISNNLLKITESQKENNYYKNSKEKEIITLSKESKIIIFVKESKIAIFVMVLSVLTNVGILIMSYLMLKK